MANGFSRSWIEYAKCETDNLMQNFDFRLKASGKILKMYSKPNGKKKLARKLNRRKAQIMTKGGAEGLNKKIRPKKCVT